MCRSFYFSRRRFEQGGHHLYRMMQQVDAALNLYKKVNYTEDKKRKQMEMVLKELTFDYLPMFLQRWAR